jgi:hypothetical protein
MEPRRLHRGAGIRLCEPRSGARGLGAGLALGSEAHPAARAVVFNFDQTRFLTIYYRRANVYICRVPSICRRETSAGGTRQPTSEPSHYGGSSLAFARQSIETTRSVLHPQKTFKQPQKTFKTNYGVVDRAERVGTVVAGAFNHLLRGAWHHHNLVI